MESNGRNNMPGFYALRLYVVSVMFFFLLVSPLISYLYIKNSPDFFESRNIKIKKISVKSDSALDRRIQELKEKKIRGFADSIDSIDVFHIDYLGIDTVIPLNDKILEEEINLHAIFDEKIQSGQDVISKTNDLFLRMLILCLIVGFFFNLPFKLYFRKLRRNASIPYKMQQYVRKMLLYTPHINTGLLLLTYLTVIIFMLVNLRKNDIFLDEAERYLFLKITIISFIASLLATVFVYYWQKHRVHLKYLQYVFRPDELQKKVFPFKRSSIQHRLLLSSFMTTLLPLALVIFYLILSYSNIHHLGLENLSTEQLRIFFGRYYDIIPDSVKNKPFFYHQLYYVNSVDSMLMIFGIGSGILISSIYIVFFVKWTKEDIIQPVKELLLNMHKTSEDGSNHYSIVRTNDEIGDLTEGYNLMTSKINEFIQKMAKINEELEYKVRERTAEIEQQNEEITTQRNNLQALNTQLAEQKEELETTLADLKETQAQLVQSEKMASLGQLTAGIAHEINNPINFVSSNINPLKLDIQDIKKILNMYRRLSDKKDIADELVKIKNFEKQIELDVLLDEIENLTNGIDVGSKRTKEIVTSLKNFSRVSENTYKEINIHEGIDSTLTLLRNKFKDSITVHKDFGEIPRVECFPGKLNQVFMNILNNAIQSIQGKGDIYIKTQVVNRNERNEPAFITVSIRDTGIGMPADIKKRIFEPFFTTKDVGGGTGLGLSISYGIIESHNGKITVESKPGKGSEFIIHLPVKQ